MTATAHTMPAEDYHADDGRISRSMIEDYITSPRRYEALYVSRSIPRPASTPAMVMGEAVHAAVLEPDRFQADYTQAPQGLRKNSKAYKEWAADHQGQIVLTAQDYQQCLEMAKAVLSSPVASALLKRPGPVEQVIRWTCPFTGLALRSRLDKMAGDGLVLDLKTASSAHPEAFAKSVVQYGYHRQAAFYSDAATALTTIITYRFGLVVVGKSRPHEVAVYELEPEAIDLGRAQYRDALEGIAHRLDTGDWSQPWERAKQTLRLPAWAYTEAVTVSQE